MLKWDLDLFREGGIAILVAIFSPPCGMSPVSPVFYTEVTGNSEYWSQKQAQRWNIHAIILNVHVGWQSAQKLSFYWSIYPTIQWNAFIFNGTIAYIGMGKLVPMDFKIQVIAIIRSFVLAFTSGLQHWSYALWQNHWSIFVQTICIWNHCQSGAQIIKIVKLLFQFLSK